MKSLLLMILLTFSLMAAEEGYERKIPNFVIDNKSIKLIDSKKAFFILGNRKYGTMKKNFAFARKEDAQKYVERTGGCVVDYQTYLKMDDKDVEEYVKKHGITIEKKVEEKKEKKGLESDIYNKENMKKYKF